MSPDRPPHVLPVRRVTMQHDQDLRSPVRCRRYFGRYQLSPCRYLVGGVPSIWSPCRDGSHSPRLGMGSDKLLDHLLPDHRNRAVDEEIRSVHTALYAPYWPRLRAFDGAADLLRACASRGLRVVLASSANDREMQALRDALDAEEAIAASTASTDVKESKPMPDIVQIALERGEVTSDAAVFVGDSIWDMGACKRAGLASIALLTGGTGREELPEAGAVEIYEGPAELFESLQNSLLGP